MRTYNPLAGCHISDACKEAVSLANQHSCPASFTFNGIELKATPDKSAGDLEAEWSRESDRRAEAYRRSPAGMKAAAQRTVEVARKQEQVDALYSEIPLHFA